MFFTVADFGNFSVFFILTLSFYLVFSICFATTFSGLQIYCFPGLNSSSVRNTLLLCSGMLWLFCLSDFHPPQLCLLDVAFPPFFSTFLALFLCSVSFFLLLSKEFVTKKKILFFEFNLLLLFSIFGLLLIHFANDFLTFYLAVELQSLCFYVLATSNKTSEFCAEAGLKYFVLGAFSSGLLLFSFALFYFVSGTLSFEALERVNFFYGDSTIDCGSIFLVASVLFKLGCFPFHMWLCDVYDGAPIQITAFFSTVPKIILFGFFLKLVFLILHDSFITLKPFLTLSGLGSILIGSVAALYQKRIKRLLAYSTVSHTGFLILAVSCFTVDSIKACTFYLIFYVIMSLCIFGILFLSSLSNKQQKYLINWSSFFGKNLTLSFFFTITLFSIAGIPPLAGFFSKLGVLLCILADNNILLASLVVLLSSIACFYYIKLVKVLAFSSDSTSGFWFGFGSKQIELLISVFFLSFSSFILWPDFWGNLCLLAALSLV